MLLTSLERGHGHVVCQGAQTPRAADDKPLSGMFIVNKSFEEFMTFIEYYHALQIFIISSYEHYKNLTRQLFRKNKLR